MFRKHFGEATGGGGFHNLWAYTGGVASWAKRLTSVATVFALSGSPALLSACMALCFQVAPMAAMAADHGGPMGQAVAASTVAVVSGHSHHGSPNGHAAVDARESTPESSDTRVGGLCNNCCPDGVAVVAGPALERTDARAFGTAPMPVPMVHFLLTNSVLGAAPHGPPGLPPGPPEALLILRI